MSTRKADNLLLFKSIIDFGSLSSSAKATDISVSQRRFYQNQGIFDQKINSVFESNSFEALFQAAIAGMGIAQIPKSLLEKQNNRP